MGRKAKAKRNKQETLIGSAAAGIVEISKETLRNAPVWAKLVLFAPAIASLLVVIGIGSIWLLPDSYKWVGGFVAIASIGIFLLPYFKPIRLDPSIPTGIVVPSTVSGSETTVWKRKLVTLPLQGQALISLSDKLAKIKGIAATYLNKHFATPSNGQPPDFEALVRANIFLPDTRHVTYGDINTLYIPQNLNCNMNDRPELLIRFRPSEGLTGRVFNNERALAVVRERFEGKASDWRSVAIKGNLTSVDLEEYELTDDQKSRINEKLRWVISFPLSPQVEEPGHAFGVLNLDGLDVLIGDEMIKALASHVLAEVLLIGTTLAAQTKVGIEIRKWEY